jgi:hypothetical protein
MRRSTNRLLLAGLLVCVPAGLWAQEPTSYAGDLLSRSTLTGDRKVLWGAQKERISNGKNVDTATVFGLRLQLVL